MKTPAVTISSRRAEGFWRCGVRHGARPRTYEAGHWTEEELVALRADPNLVVVDGVEVVSPASIPSTPTVEAALDAALSALSQATPEQCRQFSEDLVSHPDFVAAAAPGKSRKETIVWAVDVLERGRAPESWTSAGDPTVAAVEATVGFDIGAGERDAAVEEWKKTAGRDLTGG